MVSATDQPHVLRVSFFEEDTPESRAMVVCNVTAIPGGQLEITYLHHTNQARPTAKGNWESRNTFQLHTITPAFEAAVRTHVMYELFSTFCTKHKIRVSPESLMGFPQNYAEPVVS
jgi:hypothetical protein